MTNGNSFVIASAGDTLTFDNSGNGAYLTVNAGTSNAIQTAVALNDNVTAALSSGNSLSISGVVANSPGVTETLTLNGAGKLILGNANSYGPAAGSVGTTLNSGTLQVANNGALGTGDVSVAGSGTLQSGASNLSVANNIAVSSGATVTLDDNGNVFTLGGVISGSGAMTKIGSGTLMLTNNNAYSGGLTITNGTLVLSGDNSSATGAVTNGATLQLANANAVIGSTLMLNKNSTLQLRADADTTFTPASLALQNASDTLSFDVSPLTDATGHTLTLGGTLAFANSSAQTINVTGNSTYTLALGAITLTSTGHTPFFSLNVNTLPTGPGAVITSVLTGNWGNYVNLKGGGKVTVTGNLGNTSNGSLDLFVNDGTTVTLQGSSVKTGNTDAFRYAVLNGTLVLDNVSALINSSFGPGNGTGYFILGAVTNIFSGTTPNAFSPAVGVLVSNNNSFNAAVYLGDSNNLTGGLTLDASVTNYVADGDVGFTNRGLFTIGGQNTSGVNTYANPIILGWTANKGKSVTLVAATGGEVDFTGNILANGSDTTAGVTVGNATFGGIVKLTGVNTYGGATIISNGVLALANNAGVDGSISNSTRIFINAGASLDVSGRTDGTLALGAGTSSQTLQGNGTLTGNLTVGSLGIVSPGASIGTLNVSGNVVLGGATVMELNRASLPKSDEVVAPAITAGGVLTVTNLGGALQAGDTFQLFSTPVTGAFAATNLPALDNGYKYTWNNKLAVDGTIVVLTAVPVVNTHPTNITAVVTGKTLSLTWPGDHLGWTLQTNSLNLANTNDWFAYPGSASVTNENITIDPTQPRVFFRLVYP
jgi:autotransporter-associated beta strand protein